MKSREKLPGCYTLVRENRYKCPAGAVQTGETSRHIPYRDDLGRDRPAIKKTKLNKNNNQRLTEKSERKFFSNP
jgi:hypothetical protein